MSTKRIQKNLTVMFTDISGFTKHTETISRDDLMSRLETHNELLMPIIAHFEGKIVKTIGDAFLITFESPTNGVQCGLFMQHTLAKWNADKDSATQIHIKVSINSGEVTVTETDVFGDPVNVAAKIEKATNPDEIYFTESVFLAMVKAEVPTSFVKTFRPKGAESQEIKLYRVAMDEGDARYKKIINETHIDLDKMKTRVLELSTVAEREFNRYQDTMDELVKAQGKSSRGVVAAMIVAALILAVAIVFGFSMFKVSDEQRVIDASNAFLANDKPVDAREQLLNYVADHGESEAITQALNSVRTYEINRATETADEYMAGGRPEDALAELNKALKEAKPSKAQQELLDRATLFATALEFMRNGDAENALDSAEKAQSKDSPNKHIDLVVRKAKVLANARSVLTTEALAKNQAPSLIDQITITFGEDTENKHALGVLKELLILHLYWTARSDAKTMVQTTVLLEEYRKRFPRIPDWTLMQRSLALGGLWDYMASWQDRKRWLSGIESHGYDSHITELRGYGRDDAEFHFKFTEEIFEIHQKMSQVYYRCPAMWEMDEIVKGHPEFIQSKKPQIIEMCKSWLLRNNDGDSLARSLIRDHYYTEMRETLQNGMNSMKVYGSDDPKPDKTMRVNCFALSADRSDFETIENPFIYLSENAEWIVATSWEPQGNRSPKVTRQNVQAFLAMRMSEKTYTEVRNWIKDALLDIADKVKWSSSRYARDNFPLLLRDLEAAHPEYAGLND